MAATSHESQEPCDNASLLHCSCLRQLPPLPSRNKTAQSSNHHRATFSAEYEVLVGNGSVLSQIHPRLYLYHPVHHKHLLLPTHPESVLFPTYQEYFHVVPCG